MPHPASVAGTRSRSTAASVVVWTLLAAAVATSAACSSTPPAPATPPPGPATSTTAAPPPAPATAGWVHGFCATVVPNADYLTSLIQATSFVGDRQSTGELPATRQVGSNTVAGVATGAAAQADQLATVQAGDQQAARDRLVALDRGLARSETDIRSRIDALRTTNVARFDRDFTAALQEASARVADARAALAQDPTFGPLYTGDTTCR